MYSSVYITIKKKGIKKKKLFSFKLLVPKVREKEYGRGKKEETSNSIIDAQNRI